MINIKEELQTILIEAGVPAELRTKICKAAVELEQAKKEESTSDGPKSKNKFTIVLRGDAALAKNVAAGWVVQTPDEQDDNELIQRFRAAAKAQNEGQKRKKHPLITWFELFQFLKRKWTKSQDTNFMIKTKEAVRVVVLEDEKIFSETE